MYSTWSNIFIVICNTDMINIEKSVQTSMKILILFLQWLAVQELWRQLESVFFSSSSSLSFLDETTRFEALTSSWVELMSSARVSPGVVECCESGEEGRGATLLQQSQELELCKNSLSPYLLSKRQVPSKTINAHAHLFYNLVQCV